MSRYITNTVSITPTDHLGYGVGPRGSPRLKMALAAFLNSDFKAGQPVLPEEIIIFPGVMSVLDALAWSICDDHQGIIVPAPFYTGFTPAVGGRARVVLVPALFQSVQGYNDLDDIFDPLMNRKALESALLKATNDGVKVRAVMISNPHNPLGRCYPYETLREIAEFCGRHGLHLISDEVFAKSVYDNPKAPRPVPFTSVLALDTGSCIDSQSVHVAYGASKDFCASGLRLGALHSRNEGLLAAVSSICVFEWVPYVTQDMWAKMLEDEAYRTAFVAKNRRLLSEHCTILTTFLDQHNIPYYRNVNAGVFVWVDLRRYLYDRPLEGQTLDLTIDKLPASDLAKYREREQSLSGRCFASGVAISTGSSFSTEELGWFRISFAVEKEALETGLKKLLTCLESVFYDD